MEALLTLRELLHRHGSAHMLYLIYWPTRKMIVVRIRDLPKELDQDERSYKFLAEW